jgi:uncharacterized membrane protein YdbT with pleckstrin-like domain
MTGLFASNIIARHGSNIRRQSGIMTDEQIIEIVGPATFLPDLKVQEVLDASLEAVEARTDTNFAQLMCEMKALGVSLTGINSAITELRGDVSALEAKSDNTKVIIISTAVASVLAIVALTFTMIAYGQSVADTLISTFVAATNLG